MAAPDSKLVSSHIRMFGRKAIYSILVMAVALSFSVSVLTGNALTTRELMSADGLWTLALMRDIFSSGGHLADWNLAQHSDFFPDKSFGALAYAISSQPEIWLLVFEALNLALYFAIAWYCLWLYLRRLRKHRAPWSIALWGALAATALPPFLRVWGVFDNYFRYIGGPAHHFGSYFCGVLAAFIAIDCFECPLNRRTIGRVAVACVLIMLVALSDKLAILIAVPGLLVAAVYVVILRRGFPPALLTCCSLFCAAVALAYVIGDPLWNSIATITPAVPNFDQARLKRQVGLLLDALLAQRDPVERIELVGVLMPRWHDWYGLSNFIRHLDSVRTAVVAAATLFVGSLAASCIRQAVRGRPDPASLSSDSPSADAFIVYLVASAVLLPMGLIAAGVLYSYGVELYLYPVPYLILWAALARLCQRLPATFPSSQLVLGTAATSLVMSIVPLDPTAPPFGRAPKPPLVNCLEEFAKSRDLRLGLSSHWETYPVDFWSNGQIIVRTISGDARISHWIDNYQWYAPRTDGLLFTFIIDSMYIDEPALRERIGAPAEVLDCGTLGRGFSNRRILYYDHAGAERLTARITSQYSRSEYR